ncbi:MAG TPA: hypothetical protein VN238_06050 [Solirubrobacteraceae bacterium]|nr:hypothetical protein [Solirubrobacteraceae bacterium]
MWAITNLEPTETMRAVSCPTSTFCAAASAFSIHTTSNPVGGAGAWHETTGLGTPINFTDISCPSPSLCLVTNGQGDLYTSSNPTGGTGSWTKTTIAAGVRLEEVVCASPALCVISDENGQIRTSTNPAAGAGAWSSAVSLGSSQYNGVTSCPTTTLCVGSADGAVVTSTNPTGGTSAWAKTTVADLTSVFGVTCPTASTCVAYGWNDDFEVAFATSTNPTGGATAWKTTVAPPGFSDSSLFTLETLVCPSPTACLAFDSLGRVSLGTLAPFDDGGNGPGDSPGDGDGPGNGPGDEPGGSGNNQQPQPGPNPVIRTPQPPATPNPPSTPESAPATVGIAKAGKPKSISGTVRLPLSCAGAPGSSCTIRVDLRVTVLMRGKKLVGVASAARPKTKRKVLTIGTKTVTVAGGKSATITVGLTPAGKSLLKKHRTLKIEVQASSAGKRLARSSLALRR